LKQIIPELDLVVYEEGERERIKINVRLKFDVHEKQLFIQLAAVTNITAGEIIFLDFSKSPEVNEISEDYHHLQRITKVCPEFKEFKKQVRWAEKEAGLRWTYISTTIKNLLKQRDC